MLTLPRGSAHEIACTAQMHENRGHVPRFSYFVFRFCKRDKGLYAGLYDFIQRHLGHGRHGQIFLTACRLDQFFDQAVHADNLLVRSIPQRQMLSFSFDPLQHVFDRTECSCMNLHVFFIEQTQNPHSCFTLCGLLQFTFQSNPLSRSTLGRSSWPDRARGRFQ